MAGAVSRFKSIMNEKVVSFCLLGVLFWMPDIYAFLICRIWPSSECSKQSNLFLLPVTDYIYGTVVATSCDLNAPRCTTTVPQVRLHGSRGGVFVGHRPPRDPGDPLQDKKFYIYSDGTHTHTPHRGGADEMKMKVR